MRDQFPYCFFSEDEITKYITPEKIAEVDIEKVCNFIKYDCEACYRGEWSAKSADIRRLFILPDGYIVQCQRVHPVTELECIQKGILPQIYPTDLKTKTSGCPFLEALGIIRIMAEHAIVLNDKEPTKSQYNSIEYWLDSYANNLKEFEVVFQSPLTQYHIEPKDFENFDTTNYVLGLIRKHYHPTEDKI